jgi:hypothetical protein
VHWRKRQPQEEDRTKGRFRSFFAWLPTTVLGVTFWLEEVTVYEEFFTAPCEGAFHGWAAVKIVPYHIFPEDLND